MDEGLSWASIEGFLESKGFEPLPFQRDVWEAFEEGKSGLLNAPTGSGKTLALFLPALKKAVDRTGHGKRQKRLRILWLTPLRALTKDIRTACQEACDALELGWRVECRTGDTSSAVRQRQKRSMPEMLITTPESLHVLLAGKGYPDLFADLDAVVVDEWHELLGSKRGVQVELGLAHLRRMLPDLQVWGISATIGNMQQAMQVLLGEDMDPGNVRMIRARMEKRMMLETVLPDRIERFPWAGHLGKEAVEQVLPIIHRYRTVLVFTNTRSQAERWYQALIEVDPSLAGLLAMHHGSMDRGVREQVEERLHQGLFRAVVCTSSFDLGVDIRPVEAVVQVGSPKGVGRLVQRAGRSGHGPGETSRIHFVPTYALELLEGAALRDAAEERRIEVRRPLQLCFDVLLQYLQTLAVSEGFEPERTLEEVRCTHCFQELTDAEWDVCIDFLVSGGQSLWAYDEHRKLEWKDGRYRILDRGIARRHRSSIGTIVSDPVLAVKFRKGKRIGTIEEWFVSKLKRGEMFWFAGRPLELHRIAETEVEVKRSRKKRGKVPSWMGGRMPLSAELGSALREKLMEWREGQEQGPEREALDTLMGYQRERSRVPGRDELLVESLRSREGHHLFIFPFEGRRVHETMASLLAYRISRRQSISFSLAFNDLGLELLSSKPLDLDRDRLLQDLSPSDMMPDLRNGINETEMARRRFRDIAHIAGLIFQGYPGRRKGERHLRASASLIFDVFNDHEPEHLLLRQAHDEVFEQQLEVERTHEALERITGQNLCWETPEQVTPFSLPVMAERFREQLSSEKFDERLRRLMEEVVSTD
jgi:ATP-dependent Lhr-like helicase